MVPASGNKHRYRMKNLNPDSYQNCSNDSLKTRFDFSLIQIVAGEAVSCVGVYYSEHSVT